MNLHKALDGLGASLHREHQGPPLRSSPQQTPSHFNNADKHDNPHEHANNASLSGSSTSQQPRSDCSLSPTISISRSWSTSPLIASNHPTTNAHQDLTTIMSTTNTKYSASQARPTPPFTVPKPWQHAFSMVSINAGLNPQALLRAYLAEQPRQSTIHSEHTDLEARQLYGSSSSSRARGIRGVSVRCADGDPARVSLLAVVVDDIDPATGKLVVRVVTNTSVRHVLGGDGDDGCGDGLGADCPLWLPVRTMACVGAGKDEKEGKDGGERSMKEGKKGEQLKQGVTGDEGRGEEMCCQIIPCCGDWADAVDFDMPLSAEEKRVPAVVNRLVEELRQKKVALAAAEARVQDKEEEMSRLRKRQHHLRGRRGSTDENGSTWDSAEAVRRGSFGAATRFGEARGHGWQPLRAGLDGEALSQYWWVGAVVIIFMLVLVMLK